MIEFFAVSRHVYPQLRAHEFIGTVQNIGELIFTGIGVIVSDFAGNGSISGRRR